MKKIYFVLSLVLIFQSCTSDDNSSDNGNSTLNPPKFIHGVWKDELKVMGFKFTADDIITLQAGSIELSLKSQIEAIKKGNGTATVEESVTESYYEAKIILNGSQTVHYKFDKVTGSKINWKTDIVDIVDTELIKQ